jgi:thymidylate synthase ThyX
MIENISQKTLIAEAVSTWSKKIPQEIEREMDDAEFENKMKVIKEAVRDGYSSILEMPNIHVQAIMPRLDTLTLVSFSTGANFLQQSLRYTVPLIKEEKEKFSYVFIPDSLKSKENAIIKHVEKGFELYNELVQNLNVLETRKPEEDARYHLPICIGTFISASLNLSHIVHMLSLIRMHEENNIPIPSTWKCFVEELVNKISYKEFIYNIAKEIKIGKFYPNSYPLITNNIMKKIEKEFEINGKNEIKLLNYNLKILEYFTKDEIRNIIIKGINNGEFNDFSDIVFEFAVKESGIARHQIIRHRTIQQQSISIYDVAKRSEILIPASIKQSKLINHYVDYLNNSISLYEDLRNESENDAVLILPSNLAFVSKLRIDGYNIFNFRGFLGNRCCELAQAETQLIASLINNKIKEVFEKEGYKELTYILHANCFKLRKCPELIERAMYCSIFKNKSFEKPLFS